MKLTRKILLLGLSTLLVTMITIPVSAQSISSKNVKSQPIVQGVIDISHIKLGKKVILPDGAVLTQISKDEYVSKFAKEKNISV